MSNQEEVSAAAATIFPPTSQSNQHRFTFCPYCGFSLIEQKNDKQCDNCKRSLEMAPIQQSPSAPQEGRSSQVMPAQPSVLHLTSEQQQALTPVPGSQEIGLTVGSKCHFCDKLAVSKCNLKTYKFLGCDRPFCRDCGYPHFSSSMINPERVNSYLTDSSLDEEAKNMIKKANIDRASMEVKYSVANTRVCKECIPSLIAAKHQERKRCCWIFVVTIIALIAIMVAWYILKEKDDDYHLIQPQYRNEDPTPQIERSFRMVSKDKKLAIVFTGRDSIDHGHGYSHHLKIGDPKDAIKVKMDKRGVIHDQKEYYSVFDAYNGWISFYEHSQARPFYDNQHFFQINEDDTISVQGYPQYVIGHHEEKWDDEDEDEDEHENQESHHYPTLVNRTSENRFIFDIPR